MRCYLPPEAWTDGPVTLDPSESHHAVKVMRIREGDRVKVFDGRGREAEGRVSEAKGKHLTLTLESRVEHPEPALRLTLVQALLRETKMDFVFQKATELGATKILPLSTEHGVVRLKTEQLAGKIERWRTIVLNAAKQCGTCWLPEVDAVAGLGQAASVMASHELVLMGALTNDARPLKEVLAAPESRKAKSVAILVGPEGDFSPEETRTFLQVGAVPVSFGPRTLRAETAALYALSILSYEFVQTL